MCEYCWGFGALEATADGAVGVECMACERVGDTRILVSSYSRVASQQ